MIFPKVYWNDDAQPDGLTLDRVLYQVRFTDGMAGLLLDAVCIADILEDSDGEIALDALVSPFARLPRKMELLRVAMERVGATVKPSAVQITEPFKQRGVANVAAVFELSDGQTVSIFFHNPDVTPNKMAATDEVISWKWLLNKKDVTIVVAPERGVDLNVREVARRMMRLAEKNSAAFMRANVKRGERMAALEGLRSEIVTLTKELDTAKETLATLQDAAAEVTKAQHNQAQARSRSEAEAAFFVAKKFASTEAKYNAHIDNGDVVGTAGDYAILHMAGDDRVPEHFRLESPESAISAFRTKEDAIAWVAANAEPAPDSGNAEGASDSLALDPEELAEKIDLAAPDAAAEFVPPVSADEMKGWPVGPTSVPTITLTGTELDGTDGETLFDKAGAYFKANLRGKYERDGVGDVSLTGRTWRKLKGSLPHDDLKAKCIPALAEIIQRGAANGQWMPLNKKRSDDLRAFLYVEAKVQIGGTVADVIVSIGRGNFGDRGHNLSAETKMDSVLPQMFGRGSESTLVDLATDSATLPEPGEEFNIIIAGVTTAGGGEDAPAESPDVFAIGSVKFQAFAVKIRQGKQRVWGIRVLENGKEMNPADGNGAGFKSDTKASMIEDMERSYAAITKIGDKAKNENRWREGFGLAPLPAEESSTSNEQALIDAYIKAWGDEAAIVNAAVASVNWEGITDNASATAEIQKLQSAAKGERLIIKARDALGAAGMETWDSRLSGVTETEEFQAQSKAMDAYREAMDKIKAIAKEKLIEAGKAELAALPEDAPLGDVARAIYRKHGIDMGQRSDWGSRVVTAIEAKDAALAWSILNNLDNKASIEIFERATGIKLAKTQKDRAKQIDEWAGITTEKRAEIEAAKDAAWKQKELERGLKNAWGYLAAVNVRTDTGEVINGNAYLLQSFADGYTQAKGGKSPSAGAATIFVLQDEVKGKSRGLKNKAFNAFLKAAIAFGGLREALSFVGAVIPEKSAGATGDDKVESVDAAYRFVSATRNFKLWVHESLEKPDYSPFVTAKAMDEAARRNGATIEWGEFGGVAVDSVALDWVKERALYQAAIDADEDFQRELERVYGKAKANSMRMQKKYDDPKLDAARKKKLALEESLRKAWKAGEVVDSAFEINFSNENDNMKSTITFDSSSAEQIEHAMKLLEMHKDALDITIDSALTDGVEINEKQNVILNGKKATLFKAFKDNVMDGMYSVSGHNASDSKCIGAYKNRGYLDSADDIADQDDFDEEQEWEDMPDDDDALDSVALDGDFPGHPFRGNQHRKVSRQSGVAVSASVRAKKSEKSGDKRGAAKAHKSAYHAHAAAAEDDSLPKATAKYHKKMASFHKRKAGV